MKNLFSLHFLSLVLFFGGLFLGAQTWALDTLDPERVRPIFHYVTGNPQEKEISTYFHKLSPPTAGNILKTLNKLDLKGVVISEHDHPHISHFFNTISNVPEEYLSPMLTELSRTMDLCNCTTPQFLAEVSKRLTVTVYRVGFVIYRIHEGGKLEDFNSTALELKKRMAQEDHFEELFSYLSQKTPTQIYDLHQLMTMIFGDTPPAVIVDLDSFLALSENPAAGWGRQLPLLFQELSYEEDPKATQLSTIRTLGKIAPPLREPIFKVSKALTEGLHQNGKKFNFALNRFSVQKDEPSKLEALTRVTPLMRSLEGAMEMDAFEKITEDSIALFICAPHQFEEMISYLTELNLYYKDLQLLLNFFVRGRASSVAVLPKSSDDLYDFIQKLYKKKVQGEDAPRSYILEVLLQLSPQEQAVFKKALDLPQLQANPGLYFSIVESICRTSEASIDKSAEVLKKACATPKQFHETVKNLLKSSQRVSSQTSKQLGDQSGRPQESVV